MDAAREPTGRPRGIWGIRPEGILALLAAGGLLGLMSAFAIQVVPIPSASMSPTLLPGDAVLVNRLVYRLRPPRRGDLIAFRFPQAAGREFVKRVIGLPGDVVEEERGRFYVNGTRLAQAQPSGPTDEPAARPQLPRLVPGGRLYVLGDHPETSLDSRFWGPVDEREVVGEAVLICWSRGTQWWQVRWERIGRWLR